MPPRALVGRQPQLEQAAVLFGRLSQGNPDRSMILTGLRGVGKTVLLGRIRRLAVQQNWMAASFEAWSEVDLREELAAVARRFLEMVDPQFQAEAALNALRSWLPRVSIADAGVSVDLSGPPADRLEADVVGLFERLGEAARAQGTGVAIFVDELQDTPAPGLAALCSAMHRAGQEVAPIALVGAGLPTLPGRLATAKSYADGCSPTRS